MFQTDPLNPIVFKDHSGKGIPLPDPDLLRLHSALCSIMYASGAGNDIEDLLRHLDEVGSSPQEIFQSGYSFLEHMDVLESAQQLLN